MENWSVEEVCQFLKRNDFEENVIQAFRVNKVRGRVLPLLNDEDLKQLELAALGDRKYLQHLLSRACREEKEVGLDRREPCLQFSHTTRCLRLTTSFA